MREVLAFKLGLSVKFNFWFLIRKKNKNRKINKYTKLLEYH